MIGRTKSIFFVLGLYVTVASLTACSRDNGTTSPPTPGGNTLSGTIQDWSGKRALLEAITENTQGDGGFVTLIKTPISPDGSFNLTLPGEEVMKRNLRTDSGLRYFSCGDQPDSTVDVNPDTIKVSYLYLLVHASGDVTSPITGELVIGSADRTARSGFVATKIYARSIGRDDNRQLLLYCRK